MENILYEVVSSTDNGREKMSYEAFCEKIMESLKEEFSDGYEVGVSNVLKNNNVSLTGITVRRKEANVAPVLYLQNLYSEYERDSYEDVLAQTVAQFKDANKDANIRKFSDLTFPSWTEARATIVCKLVNGAKNAEFLKTVPWVPFADLAVVFYLFDSRFYGMISINNNIVKDWGVTVSQLEKAAMDNTYHALMPTFLDIKKSLSDTGVIEEVEKLPLVKEIPEGMWTLSNYFGEFGAASILYPAMRKKIGKAVGGRYYAIPNSIHEWIIVPECPFWDAHAADMIKDAIIDNIPEKEMLSDHPYLFDEHGNLVK